MAAALAALLCVAVCARAAPLAGMPDILFVLSDDLGFAEVGFTQGSSRTNTNLSTPNVDALAASGVIMSDAYVGAPVCAPSRCALMTGLHSGHGTIRGNRDVDGHDFPLRANDTTFFSSFAAAGYHVSCVGKWGVGWVNNSGSPVSHGCTDFFGVLDQNEAHDMYPSDSFFTWRWPAANGSRVWEAIPYAENVGASRARCMAAGNSCVWSHDLWTRAAMAAIAAQGARRVAAAAAGAAAPPPLLLYLAYTDPHAGGWLDNDAEEGNPVPSDGGFTDPAWPVVERDHASVIVNFQDVDVGALVAATRAAGGPAGWLTLFASDNGASNEGGHDYAFFNSSGPLRGFKRCLTEGGIRTPFALSWPGRVAPGTVLDTPLAFWDVGPTLLDLAGVPPALWPQRIDGVSLAPLMRGGPAAPYANRTLYWEFCTAVHPPLEPRAGAGWGHAVRRGPWKAVSFFADQPLRLYNLTEDVYEVHDRAAEFPDVVAELAAFAAAAHVDSADFPVANCKPS
jgi:arylsulfatase A